MILGRLPEASAKATLALRRNDDAARSSNSRRGIISNTRTRFDGVGGGRAFYFRRLHAKLKAKLAVLQRITAEVNAGYSQLPFY